MGGRGSMYKTVGGGGGKGGGDKGVWLEIPKTKEKRADIRKLFIDELGFQEMYGTNKIPTAQLAALAIELKKHEKTYNVIKNEKVSFFGFNKEGTRGVAIKTSDGLYLGVNAKIHSSVTNQRKSIKEEQRTGFKVKTDGRVTKDFTQTARHEYGHLLQYQITSKTKKSDTQIRKEVNKIAKTKYNSNTLDPSGYGAKNHAEFFAESFSSMTGGNPNAQGKALKDWIKKNYK